jgi:hypothetical protein
MKRANKGIWVLIAIFALWTAGCVVHKDGNGGSCNDCGGSDAGWYSLTPETELAVGQMCPLGFPDQDFYPDYIELSDADYGLDRINMNYYIENVGPVDTDITITLCDDYGCEDVAFIQALMPGEHFSATIDDSEVLDSAMDEFWYCLDNYGDYCSMTYDIDVYVYEDFACSPVYVDYYFTGLYLW